MEPLVLKLIWFHLVCLRFMLCIAPQYGYVFPDEFFQSPEIMAGDVFRFTHFRTWEWTIDSPVRNIVFPFFSAGLPFLLLRYLSSFFDVTTHGLLIFPRLWMAFLSLVNDIIVYKLAHRLFNDVIIANTAVVLFASSYTTWVYCTRTFSNGIETILFGLLLYLVTSDGSKSAKSTEKQSKNPNKSDKTKAFFISIVAVAGVFTRVSFLAFMIVPLLYWLFRDITYKPWHVAIRTALKRSMFLLPGAICATIFFVLSDAYYFKYDTVLELPRILRKMDLTLFYQWVKKLPLTPLNCLQYNADLSNLEKHGIHPWYLHATVNLPLLFTPLVYLLIPALSQIKAYLPKSDNNNSKRLLFVLIGSIMIGLGGLSSVSHQEPRYILPLVVPIIVLMSRCFHPVSSRKILLVLWIFFNSIFLIFFALLHQGGVVPSMDYVSSLSKAHSGGSSHVEIIYYKTYLPPVHLAVLPQQSRQFKVTDLAGSPHEVLEATLKSAISKQNADVYLVFPATIPCQQINNIKKTYFLEVQYSLFPHLSMENPPWDEDVCHYDDEEDDNIFTRMINKMTLNFYKVTPVKRPDAMDPITLATNSPHVQSSTS